MRVVIMDLRTLVVERPVVEIQYSGRDVPNMSATQVIEHLGSDYLLLAFDNHIKVLSLNTGEPQLCSHYDATIVSRHPLHRHLLPGWH